MAKCYLLQGPKLIINSVKFVNLRTFRTSSITNSATIINGKRLAQEIQDEVRAEIALRCSKGYKRPNLNAILVGNNPSSLTYLKNKMIATQYVGIESKLITMDEQITEIQLIKQIQELNLDTKVDGILIQLPLPPHINEYKICNAVDQNKDVDGFHFENAGRMYYDITTGLLPCTAVAVIELLKRMKIDTFGKRAVVCGRSKNVGLATALFLQADSTKSPYGMDATVSICNRNTTLDNLISLTRDADIIISAVGKPNLITDDMIKPGACVIDVGINKIILPNGKSKLVGDVDFEGVSKVAGYVTPVPGGVGPMTVAILLRNTLEANKYNIKV